MAGGGDHEGSVAVVPAPVEGERKTTRVPAGSIVFSRLLPILIVGLAIVLAVLLLIAGGVLFGFIPYR